VLFGGAEVDVEVEGGEGDGLALGVFGGGGVGHFLGRAGGGAWVVGWPFSSVEREKMTLQREREGFGDSGACGRPERTLRRRGAGGRLRRARRRRRRRR
jgi:hypothetical protein